MDLRQRNSRDRQIGSVLLPPWERKWFNLDAKSVGYTTLYVLCTVLNAVDV
jgi:hypothetical protein